MEWKKILCPVDFSDTSRRAAEAAMELARRFGADVTLFHSFELPIFPVPDGTYLTAGTIDEISDQIRDTLVTWKKDLLPLAGHGRIRTDYSMGFSANEIVQLAAKEKFDLIVMGTHGRTGIRHAVMGSVAERVVRTAPCPVLTVRPAQTPARPEGKRAGKAKRR